MPHLRLKGLSGSRLNFARFLAIIGGLAGFIGVVIGIGFNGLDFILVIKDEDIEVSRTLVGMAWALTGILGGVIVWGSSKVPGLIMLVSGVGGIVTMPAYFAVGGFLLPLGAVAALTTKDEAETSRSE